MSANRVVDSHFELDDIGTHTHVQIDDHIDNTPFVIVSGTTGPVPPSARKLAAGPGITISDHGAGQDLVISASVTASLSVTPTQVGQLLFAVTTSSFVAALPIVTLGFTPGWMMNDDGILLVSASL